ncbi:acyl-CoA Delta-9 desaturase-like [Neocloeon triangulifer]|uniref:acyl-CoA Delta-9 desaturase-like n=1 Tax=Neocloeon triangulifer TaxID=2078957 RepID=UPI00286EB7DD|nr:acyl-CoA Delta-9 desaturase-like [Neocloeon triangulifer]
MAPNHQVTLGPEILDTQDEAVAHTEELIKSIKSVPETLTKSAPTEAPEEATTTEEPHLPLKWANIVGIFIFHAVATYGFFVTITQGYWLTVFWMYGMGQLGGIGVTGGVHRLWTHRAYKAKLPLRIILAMLFSLSGQNSIFDWVRDHRVHHKFSETNADPHNANRGFFFAHVGWLMQKKHPAVIENGRKVDMSDVLSDPVVQFHLRHFWTLKVLLCGVLPMVVPALFWGETWRISFYNMAARYMFGLNFTWLVNSAAHIWGHKPYDRFIQPTENRIVAVLALGEGWHNYHHVFPWDYKTSEHGTYSFNWTTAFIDFFAWIGWAYDLKQVTPAIIERRSKRTGDGSRATHGSVGGVHISEEEEPEPDDFLLPSSSKQD